MFGRVQNMVKKRSISQQGAWDILWNE